MADELLVWHDESDRLATWGTLDPLGACMCTSCVLGDYPPVQSPGGAA